MENLSPIERFKRIDAAAPQSPPQPQRVLVESHGGAVPMRAGLVGHNRISLPERPSVEATGAWQAAQGFNPQDGATRSLRPGETVADRFNAAADAARAIQPDPPNAIPGKVTAHPGGDSRRK